MTTPGPAAMVAATCMAAVVGVNPWVMEAGEPMVVAPGVAVRCSAEGAGVEAVADLIKAPCIFFSFFGKKSIPLENERKKFSTPGSVMIF